ncbi:hypothetical protein TRICI_005242 [Trichomonascus ciferrii]|uniref:C2H2-type domain-containing protein n=1 Tax=Trichomonascus ciferrii TaxID=44093 RepID=A0A642UWI3_9ASCO|nr:hypothetical protein TRICI_005242 [Trichomonascus ciferrii]
MDFYTPAQPSEAFLSSYTELSVSPSDTFMTDPSSWALPEQPPGLLQPPAEPDAAPPAANAEPNPGMPDNAAMTSPPRAAAAQEPRFVSVSGPAKRRRRRKYNEIVRLYACNHPKCPKAYGTLNHLNAHVSLHKHGPRRRPDEFREIRRLWKLLNQTQNLNDQPAATN